MTKRKTTHVGPTCVAKKCDRQGVLWRRLNWWCLTHRPDDSRIDMSCKHSTDMHYGGVSTCSWCCSTIACDWPRTA